MSPWYYWEKNRNGKSLSERGAEWLLGLRHHFDASSLHNPAILDWARRVEFTADKNAPGRSQFKDWVIVETTDGRCLERIENNNWGSREKPMTPFDIEAKFHNNAGVAFGPRTDRKYHRCGT